MKPCITCSSGQGSRRQIRMDSSAFRTNQSNSKFNNLHKNSFNSNDFLIEDLYII